MSEHTYEGECLPPILYEGDARCPYCGYVWLATFYEHAGHLKPASNDDLICTRCGTRAD